MKNTCVVKKALFLKNVVQESRDIKYVFTNAACICQCGQNGRRSVFLQNASGNLTLITHLPHAFINCKAVSTPRPYLKH